MPSFLLFVSVFTLVLGLVNAYLYRWTVRAFSLSARARTALGILLAATLLALFVGRAVGRAYPEAPLRGLIVVASTVQLSVLISFFLLMAVDAILVVKKALERAGRFLRRTSAAPRNDAAEQQPASALVGRAVQPTASPPAENAVPPATSAVTGNAVLPAASTGNGVPAAATPAVPRRAFLAQAAASSVFLFSGSNSVYGALAGRHDYSIDEVPIAIPGLSRALDGFTIVQLSDVHIGMFVDEPELRAAEHFVARARPDLIVLTGDLIDNDGRLAYKLGRFVRRLAPLAREGIVAISGNHDFYSGIDETVDALEGGGARVLRNRGVVIGERGAGFALLGVDDVRAPRFVPGGGPDLDAALASLPAVGGRVSGASELPRILLCHNPVYFEKAAGRVALQLSGHTHGGQINPFVRPADWVLKNGWVAGSYHLQGSHLYVNRGFGTAGLPARIGAPPEITRIVLTV